MTSPFSVNDALVVATNESQYVNGDVGARCPANHVDPYGEVHADCEQRHRQEGSADRSRARSSRRPKTITKRNAIFSLNPTQTSISGANNYPMSE